MASLEDRRLAAASVDAVRPVRVGNSTGGPFGGNKDLEIAVIVIVVAVLLLLCCCGFFWWRRRSGDARSRQPLRSDSSTSGAGSAQQSRIRGSDDSATHASLSGPPTGNASAPTTTVTNEHQPHTPLLSAPADVTSGIDTSIRDAAPAAATSAASAALSPASLDDGPLRRSSGGSSGSGGYGSVDVDKRGTNRRDIVERPTGAAGTGASERASALATADAAKSTGAPGGGYDMSPLVAPEGVAAAQRADAVRSESTSLDAAAASAKSRVVETGKVAVQLIMPAGSVTDEPSVAAQSVSHAAAPPRVASSFEFGSGTVTEARASAASGPSPAPAAAGHAATGAAVDTPAASHAVGKGRHEDVAAAPETPSTAGGQTVVDMAPVREPVEPAPAAAADTTAVARAAEAADVCASDASALAARNKLAGDPADATTTAVRDVVARSVSLRERAGKAAFNPSQVAALQDDSAKLGEDLSSARSSVLAREGGAFGQAVARLVKARSELDALTAEAEAAGVAGDHDVSSALLAAASAVSSSEGARASLGDVAPVGDWATNGEALWAFVRGVPDVGATISAARAALFRDEADGVVRAQEQLSVCLDDARELVRRDAAAGDHGEGDAASHLVRSVVQMASDAAEQLKAAEATTATAAAAVERHSGGGGSGSDGGDAFSSVRGAAYKALVSASARVSAKIAEGRAAVLAREEASFVEADARAAAAKRALAALHAEVDAAGQGADEHVAGAMSAASDAIEYVASLRADVLPPAGTLGLSDTGAPTARRMPAGGDWSLSADAVWEYVRGVMSLHNAALHARGVVAARESGALDRARERVVSMLPDVEALQARNAAAGEPEDATTAAVNSVLTLTAELERTLVTAEGTEGPSGVGSGGESGISSMHGAELARHLARVSQLATGLGEAWAAVLSREGGAFAGAEAVMVRARGAVDAARADARNKGALPLTGIDDGAAGELPSPVSASSVAPASASASPQAAGWFTFDESVQRAIDNASEEVAALERAHEALGDVPRAGSLTVNGGAEALWDYVWAAHDALLPVTVAVDRVASFELEAAPSEAESAAEEAAEEAAEARLEDRAQEADEEGIDDDPEAVRRRAMAKLRRVSQAVRGAIRMKLDLAKVAGLGAATNAAPVGAVASVFEALSPDALLFVHFASTLMPKELTRGKSPEEVAEAAMLWSLFHHYASAGDPTNATHIGSNQFRKFCRDAHVIQGAGTPHTPGAATKRVKYLNRAQVDIIEAKIEAGGKGNAAHTTARARAMAGTTSTSGRVAGTGGRAHEKSMDFDEFCAAAGMIALELYAYGRGVRSSIAAAASAGAGASSGVSTPEASLSASASAAKGNMYRSPMHKFMVIKISPVIETEARHAAAQRAVWERRGGGSGWEERRAGHPQVARLLRANQGSVALLFEYYANLAEHRRRAAGKTVKRKPSVTSVRDSLARAHLGTRRRLGSSTGNPTATGEADDGDADTSVVSRGTESLRDIHGGSAVAASGLSLDFGAVLTFARDFDIVPTVLNMSELLELFTQIVFFEADDAGEAGATGGDRDGDGEGVSGGAEASGVAAGAGDSDDFVEVRETIALPQFDVLLGRLAMRKVLVGEVDDDAGDAAVAYLRRTAAAGGDLEARAGEAGAGEAGADAALEAYLEHVRAHLASAETHMAEFLRALNASDGFARLRKRSRGGVTFTRFKVGSSPV